MLSSSITLRVCVRACRVLVAGTPLMSDRPCFFFTQCIITGRKEERIKREGMTDRQIERGGGETDRERELPQSSANMASESLPVPPRAPVTVQTHRGPLSSLRQLRDVER